MSSPPSRRRARITLVDDDREQRLLLRRALEQANFEVAEASSGLRLISTLLVDRPDLLLLDVLLPWMDGFELCRALKANPDFAPIPIVFYTARGAEEDIQEGQAAGCVEYLVKPLNLSELTTRLRALVPGYSGEE